ASNYRQVPIGVVVPKTRDDVIATMRACRRFGAQFLSRGGGTSLAGQCCNVAVVVDYSKHLDRIVEIDAAAQRARVEPGCVLDDLRDAAERFHLTFAPDPSTHTHNTLGGMIGNNSCGVHSVMGGKTVDNVESLRVLTYDGLELDVGATSDAELARIIAAGGRRGEIYAALRDLRDRYADEIRARFPKIPRRVSGYNLDSLLPENGFHVARALVGSEGTCVAILEAACRLVPSPPARSLLVLGYRDVFAAADHVPDILEYGPIGLEGIDDRLIDDMKAIGLHPRDVELLPEGRGWLLVELGGQTRAESDARARRLMEALGKRDGAPSMRLYEEPSQELRLWKVRGAGLGATAHVPNKRITWEGWEDAAVPPANLGAYLRDFRALLDRFGYEGDLYGHFGQGCVHTRIDFDLETRQGIATYRAFIDEAADLVVHYGGSLSGEHGDGQSRAELLPRMFGPTLVRAFAEFKAIFDPDGRMNPGKIVDPYSPIENLRIGTGYDPPVSATHFGYPTDGGSFSRAVLRCVGVGECRRHDSGTMCPSYRATREERHSTRGRARMLFEMQRGEIVRDGWRDEAVRESLDLCLACKGCKHDCPVSVDMATYKAEFLSHHYRKRLRPRAAYVMGGIRTWAALASRAPRLVNALTHAAPTAALFKAIGGLAREREIPRFAGETFVDGFRARTPRPNAGRPRVILWPDTFTNHFLPARGHAAVAVLAAAGFDVELPSRPLCCGRPLYDFGWLDRARRRWIEILDAMREPIGAGVPIVGLEPSCVSAFRDELGNLLPHSENAMRLARQVFTLAEFLETTGWKPPRLARKAIVHGHCHHKAIMSMRADTALLDALGLEWMLLDDGCCGLAGSFGFERGKYEVSMAIGELALLPRVREAGAETLILADGFSCREQILHGAGQTALHLAEVIALALEEGGTRP
ncbi:MAG TPA: FAD-linked oxidase C-terminal domain-containing protein, partial [Rhodanobacteraceae bacterium]|nr:FAD-linked oxidase C-terminal domain-containing protein [Rhodanobacteraceae bacterium]